MSSDPAGTRGWKRTGRVFRVARASPTSQTPGTTQGEASLGAFNRKIRSLTFTDNCSRKAPESWGGCSPVARCNREMFWKTTRGALIAEEQGSARLFGEPQEKVTGNAGVLCGADLENRHYDADQLQS